MALLQLNSTTVMIVAALAAALLFQIDWLFFLAIALTTVVLLTNKPASHAKHKHEKTEEAKTGKKTKRRVVIVRQPVHHQPSDVIGEKMIEEILERPLLQPWEGYPNDTTKRGIKDKWEEHAGRGKDH